MEFNKINQHVDEKQRGKDGPEDFFEIEAVCRDLFEFLPDGVVIVDHGGNILLANARIEKSFGYDRDEIIGKPIEILVPERIAERHAEMRKRYMSKPKRRQIGIGLEPYGRRKDGSEFPVDIALIPLEIGGKVVVAGVIRDYTWRKRGEEAAYRLAALVESSDDAIIGMSLDGIILSWNAAAERIYGYSPEEVKGRSVSILVPSERSHEVPEILGRVGQGEAVIDHETVLLRKDGGKIHVSRTISPVKDGFGNIIGISSIARDITDRKRAEQEIKNMNERLKRLYEDCEATNKELEAFSYSVSHDLRTPLVAIGGFTRILLETYANQMDAKGEELLHTIYKKTEQMNQLISDLLAYSRFGRQALEYSDIDMNELAKGVIEEVKLLEGGRMVEVNVRPLPPVRGDQTLIRQVLANLLSNAFKFTRLKPNAAIEIGCKAEDAANIYFVKDNGVGFEMADSDKLFEAFKRLHSPKDFEGTGIGLAIVKRIIYRHGGRVWAEGKINEGAVFYFSLPR